MEKIKKFINKHDLLFIIIIMVIFNIIWIRTSILESMDEIWNFQNLYKIHQSNYIYEKDINIIITPLFFIIGEVFIKIFGANFFAFSIYSSVINVATVSIIFLIFKELKMNSKTRITLTIGLFFMINTIFFGNNANYNLLALLWCLISILIGIKNKNKKIKLYNIIQGILCFFVLFTKQNIGVFFILGITVGDLIEKASIRVKMKNIFTKYFVIGILGSIFLIYLFTTKTWNNFVFYILSGLGEFTKNFKMSINTKYNEIGITVAGIIFLIIGLKNKMFSDMQKKYIYFLTPIAICMLGIMYPIFNVYHKTIACIISIILAAYTIITLFHFENSEWFYKILCMGSIILSLSYIDGVYINLCSQTITLNDTANPLYGIRIEKSDYEKIIKIDNYILEKEKQGINVIMIYEKSGMYMLPIRHFNGKFDCFNNGNLGKDGANGVIEEIKQMKNAEILIVKDDDDVFWQEPKEVREYIKENLKNIGEIEEFSIYATKMEGE